MTYSKNYFASQLDEAESILIDLCVRNKIHSMDKKDYKLEEVVTETREMLLKATDSTSN